MTKRFIAKINIFTVYYLNGSMHHLKKKDTYFKNIGDSGIIFSSGVSVKHFRNTEQQLEFLDVVLAGSLASQLIRI